jgi:hypothetical protein
MTSTGEPASADEADWPNPTTVAINGSKSKTFIMPNTVRSGFADDYISGFRTTGKYFFNGHRPPQPMHSATKSWTI